ncbi:hypothetical protein VIBNISOn1_1560001 [Vibrio nigripulchritudo SOn1]|uniref:Uncharacterized protein n=1 Tax=Vibrio nigripulchritudo SOn1 TaxID=1238450 RepID=A0AAV2VLY1_9VIBR|nr:hypothetical protein VIBNISOn1_1560001 [Vibrio nigripulchritudo SOn1]
MRIIYLMLNNMSVYVDSDAFSSPFAMQFNNKRIYHKIANSHFFNQRLSNDY